MIIRTMPVGIIQTNCYLIGDETTGQGAVIDPGGDPQIILDAVESEGLTIGLVLITHAHWDHIAVNDAVLAATGASFALHPADTELLATGGGGRWFGLVTSALNHNPDIKLSDGQKLTVGGLGIRVLHTPGHSPGHVAFYLKDREILFSGDAIFHDGMGRYDLPGGDYLTLITSIRNKLLILPDETAVYPGHGPPTTIGAERGRGRFLQGRTSPHP